MISAGFKKELIDNAYNTQLLPVKKDKVYRDSISTNKRIKIWLLFRKDDESLWVGYKINTINYDIFWFLYFLIMPIYSIYQDSRRNEKSYIQENILYYIKETIERKQIIDNNLDYAEYLEDIYD
jgi:hypothetical protein